MAVPSWETGRDALAPVAFRIALRISEGVRPSSAFISIIVRPNVSWKMWQIIAPPLKLDDSDVSASSTEPPSIADVNAEVKLVRIVSSSAP